MHGTGVKIKKKSRRPLLPVVMSCICKATPITGPMGPRGFWLVKAPDY